ncbi:phage tail protein [Corynebacterium liangguodongii]|uniref:Phage tail protein n=1 Tax=Corynebacterium liangguodongii TaxID=2079535 RepID=A0A2S0WG63_9CORY|nr:phage tail protein [Corynebacterium liangguodongii]AWB84763.1 phage tail protein [Corynebacterium liangguodongii]PWB99121.1 phage tail protein [Corynebacterium liangguodongii]
MTVPTYHDLETKLILRWVDTEDVMATQRAIIEVTPEAAYLELPRGLRGEKGDKGDPGPGFWFRQLITNRNQLPTNLRDVDRGSAFPDTTSKSLWVWDGADYFEIPNFIGLRGEPGVTPRVQIGKVEPGGDAAVSVNQAASTPDTFVLDFTLPQGPVGPPGKKGDTGTASNVSSSPDVDVSRPPAVGEALTWNGSKWAPRNVLAPIGPFQMGPNDFQSFSQDLIGSSDLSEKLIGSMTVPGLPFDWRPVVLGGHLQWQTDLGIQCNVDVRVGNAQRGDIVGHGVGVRNGFILQHVSLHPWSTGQVVPGSTYGVVKANTATTIYVVMSKVYGSVGRWDFTRQNAGLTFMAMPAVIV